MKTTSTYTNVYNVNKLNKLTYTNYKKYSGNVLSFSMNFAPITSSNTSTDNNKFKLSKINIILISNQFDATALILYPLQILENLRSSNVFRGYRKKPMA